MTRGIVLAGLVLLGLAEGVRAAEPPSSLGKIDHIVVLYLENRSFDNMFGLFPGANGLGQAVNAPPQAIEPETDSVALLL